jgi:excisionase family DNA binding protein
MMTCQECRDSLSALIDRELSAEELKEVQTHLQECVECCQECTQLCCVDAATKQACCPEVPADLWERVQEADVLTPEEAAFYLRVSVNDLLASLDSLPHVRIGKQIRFSRRGLRSWLEVQQRKTWIAMDRGGDTK